MTANIRGICRQSASMYEPMPARMRAFFVCAEPVIFTCLFHVGAAALLALTGSASRTAWYPHKRESLDRAAVRHNEECDGTHAHRPRSEEHTSELQSQSNLVCRLLLEKKKKETQTTKTS